jgi:hypothetical protein
MLIVLNQDNKKIAELFAVAPRSVWMFHHRFRQRKGISTEHSLEYFIAYILRFNDYITTSEATISQEAKPS